MKPQDYPAEMYAVVGRFVKGGKRERESVCVCRTRLREAETETRTETETQTASTLFEGGARIRLVLPLTTLSFYTVPTELKYMQGRLQRARQRAEYVREQKKVPNRQAMATHAARPARSCSLHLHCGHQEQALSTLVISFPGCRLV